MRILLLSDTHGHMDETILQYVREADVVWHAGDIGTSAVTNALSAIRPLKAVYGNIDGRDIRMQFPLDERFTVEGIDVWITHIGGYPGHYQPRVRKILTQSPPDLFICGHSHILKVMRDAEFNMLCMNPGAAGVQGFHKMRTMIRFTVVGGRILQPEVIELGLRGSLRI